MPKQYGNINKFKFKKKNNWFRKKTIKKSNYVGVLKKTNNNTFITIMTKNKGHVIVSISAGNCRIKSKKKKKAMDTLKTIASTVGKLSVTKNITRLYNFYILKYTTLRPLYTIYNAFRERGLYIDNFVYIKKRAHSLPNRKRKIRRV